MKEKNEKKNSKKSIFFLFSFFLPKVCGETKTLANNPNLPIYTLPLSYDLTATKPELSATHKKNLYQAIRLSLVNTLGTYLCPSEVECAAMTSYFMGPPAPPLGGSGNGSQDTGDGGRGEGGSPHKKAKRDETPTGSCVNLSLCRASFVTTPLACLSNYFFFPNRSVYCGTLDEMSLT